MTYENDDNFQQFPFMLCLKFDIYGHTFVNKELIEVFLDKKAILKIVIVQYHSFRKMTNIVDFSLIVTI